MYLEKKKAFEILKFNFSFNISKTFETLYIWTMGQNNGKILAEFRSLYGLVLVLVLGIGFIYKYVLIHI